MSRTVPILLAALALAGCGKLLSPAAEDEADAAREAAAQPTRTLIGSGAVTSGSLRDQTYAEWDRERRSQADALFMGFRCIGTCMEHRSGYRWAKSSRIDRTASCTGNSWAMVEGCVAYVTEQRGAGRGRPEA